MINDNGVLQYYIGNRHTKSMSFCLDIEIKKDKKQQKSYKNGYK